VSRGRSWLAQRRATFTELPQDEKIGMTLPSWITRALTFHGLSITEAELVAALDAEVTGPGYFGKITIHDHYRTVVFHYQQGNIVRLELGRITQDRGAGIKMETMQTITPVERIVEFRKG
jgi:hypothetical protein